MNILTRMIQNGFRNIPVVFNEGHFFVCRDVLKIAHARPPELTESKRKLMPLAINLTEEKTRWTQHIVLRPFATFSI